MAESEDTTLEEFIASLLAGMIELHGIDPELSELLQTEVPQSGGGTSSLSVRLYNPIRKSLAARSRNRVPSLDMQAFFLSNMIDSFGQYERLGFIFTPLTVPRIPLQVGGSPEPIGAGNRCAIFRNNYLEILGVIDAGRWGSITREQRGPFDLDEPLNRYEGLHVLHLGTGDLDHVHSRLRKDGLHPSDIRSFQRLVDTQDGPKMMRARCLHFPHGSNPEALVQVAQHITPELVLQPRYMQHPNGAISITEVIVCVDDPESVARKYGVYTDQTVRANGGLRVVEFGQSRIIVISPDDLQEVLPRHIAPVVPFLAGFAVSSDLRITRQLLKEREIDFHMHDGRILVNARDGYGAAVFFENTETSS